jgi:hypothetical protein
MAAAGLKAGDRVHHPRWQLNGTVIREVVSGQPTDDGHQCESRETSWMDEGEISALADTLCHYCDCRMNRKCAGGCRLCSACTCDHETGTVSAVAVRFDGTDFTETECEVTDLDQIAGTGDPTPPSAVLMIHNNESGTS